MIQQSEALFSFLTSETDFTAVMGTKIYPIVALEGVQPPFATYRIQEEMPRSQDGDAADIQLFCWFSANKYKECATLVDKLKPIIENSPNYIWQSQTIDYIEDAGTFVGIINFKTY